MIEQLNNEFKEDSTYNYFQLYEEFFNKCHYRVSILVAQQCFGWAIEIAKNPPNREKTLDDDHFFKTIIITSTELGKRSFSEVCDPQEPNHFAFSYRGTHLNCGIFKSSQGGFVKKIDSDKSVYKLYKAGKKAAQNNYRSIGNIIPEDGDSRSNPQILNEEYAKYIYLGEKFE